MKTKNRALIPAQIQLNIDGMTKKNVCVFTGHRIIDESFSLTSLQMGIEKYVCEGVTTFLTGMAAGFDLLAAEQVLLLKKKYPRVKLCACIPCLSQDKYYSLQEQIKYKKILKRCDEKIVLSENYYQGCMHRRNDYMVERADCMIAYLLQEKGGTMYTVKKFQRNKPKGEIFFV